MAQIQINGETFDVFVVRGTESPPLPIEMNVAPRSVAGTVKVNSSTTSVTLAAANSNRKGISIYNNSSATLLIGFATPTTSDNFFLKLPPEAFLMLDQQLMVSNAIYGIWSAVSGAAQVTQYT